MGARADNLGDVIESDPRVHRTATIIFGAFYVPLVEVDRSLLTALKVLRQLYASGERKLGFGSVNLRARFEERADCSDVLPVFLKDISLHLTFLDGRRNAHARFFLQASYGLPAFIVP